MSEKLIIWESIKSVYHDVPTCVYEGFLVAFLLFTIVILFVHKIKYKARLLFKFLLIDFLFIVYCSTVVYRNPDDDQGFNLCPLWSYKAYLNGQLDLLAENIMNVMAFVPIGLLLGLSYKRIKLWQVLLVGIAISASMEILQFIMKCGFSEVDDVLHNTLGCMMGYGIFSMLLIMYNRIRNCNKQYI